MQYFGFCTADFRSWVVFESAVQKPKHFLTCSFLHTLFILPPFRLLLPLRLLSGHDDDEEDDDGEDEDFFGECSEALCSSWGVD